MVFWKRCLTLALAGSLSIGAHLASAAELVVIVNGAHPAESLTAKQVKAYFLKNPATWADGSRVRPVDNLSDAQSRAAFLSEVLGMSDAELERYWISRQYATAEEPPPRARDDAEMIKLHRPFERVRRDAPHRHGGPLARDRPIRRGRRLALEPGS